jgi:hypothetical protein
MQRIVPEQAGWRCHRFCFPQINKILAVPANKISEKQYSYR